MKFEDHPHVSNPDIKVLLDQLVNGAAGILGDNFIGAWLQGSSATGHFDEHSDLDFVIGVERDLSDDEVSTLQQFHRQLFNHRSRWAQHLEGSYIPRNILRDYKLAGKQVWYLDHGSTTFERSAHDNTIAVKWIVREKGVVLVGPDPKAIMDPIPVAELRQDIYLTFAKWADVIFENHDEISSHFYQTFAVLSYCRMLNDIRCGEIGSKREGAEWVKANLDPGWRDLIDRAWLGRPEPSLSVRRPAEPEDVQRTIGFIRVCLEEARKLLRSFGHDPESIFDAA
ncbi:MAG: aminoglycoside adenylyltransferase domain-containing protein [Anaerolineales bacterium]